MSLGIKKFKGDISSEIENLPVKNEGDILTCPNYLISEDKKYCL